MIENKTKIHKSKNLDGIKKSFPEEDTLFDLSDFFKVLGDPTRIKILFALSQSELYVYDISNLLGMSSSSISHQLRILRNTKLVKSKKVGKMVIYSLADHHIKSLFQQGLEHVLE